jgi:hypothetical protein
MSDWERLIEPKASVWTGVTMYCDERIAALTEVCISPGSTDLEIRNAQAAIEELRLLKGVPNVIQTKAKTAGGRTKRQGY